jgi:hypothetical protein
MNDKSSSGPEIESFNLEDLDISALDTRLELTTLLPHNVLPVCSVNCETNSSGGGACVIEGFPHG